MSLREAYADKLKRQGTRTTFDRHGKPHRRKPLKKIGKALRNEHAIYLASFEAWVQKPGNESCAICRCLFHVGNVDQVNPTTERHHFRGRHHKLLNWEPGWVPCCRFHREWPHQPKNRVRAEAWGIISTRTEFDTYPPELRNAA